MQFSTLRRFIVLLVTAAVPLACTSCGDFIQNQIEPRQGDIQFIFVNNTPFRAVFSYGTYDELDRDPPGPVALNQIRIEGNQTTAPVTVTCRRNAAIGTDAFIERCRNVQADRTVNNFDPDAFTPEVNFSSAGATGTAAGLPTEGTARGRMVKLGVDYGCRDRLFFIFEQDADAPGGFRIDYQLIVAPDPVP